MAGPASSCFAGAYCWLRHITCGRPFDDSFLKPPPGQSADDGLVAVAALTLNPETNRWQRAAFSTGGSYLDIAAPGVKLKTASAEDRAWYSAREGTSFAAPLVSGALAILRQAHPTWSSAQIEAALKAHAQSLTGESADTVGAGMLNLRDLP